MKIIIQQISKILALTVGALCLAGSVVTAQVKKHSKPKAASSTIKAPVTNTALSAFLKEATNAGIEFKVPAHFKEIPAINNENFSFDYAMVMPSQDFEVWLQVHSLKQNWSSYEQVKNITGKALANPDSAYLDAAKAHVAAMSDEDDKYFVRSLTSEVLQQYNADAGKTYFFSLSNLPETKQYKYALLIAIQKHHTGYMLAVCLTNQKGPEFFRNINKARDCIKFK
ncbi:hypothetical protein ABDD95_16900 [Mucilaginibacter sp. PAMB04274]|uniref:hypothetical protein n=1 Tax=Mucilaginibacter sp. PAMB04274 TaxID=3138568 RepID=UPI0031F64317